ncbi:FtsX-like permease family protein [Halalkalibacterium halodurans]|jgi:ABC-type antimicrobial peptide transport system permease subunit|uniref:ABC3 transporter permease C-terminal domain-containing protein n=1 Tax=Halalkalibacterium halodurans TaxID=86665 RepID=A0A0M0KG22_ALKHA|nr:FtsX-like permease family protein [Halalkalibacterium halodurans]MED3646644.1 FtsX-like permease family protein [Halalkalibacterium halodurans]TPE66982.1 ABC transporter permease [Halalkalibacterium halodurans]
MTLLKKSLYIIAYYIVVATFSCLAFSSLIDSYEQTATLPDGLSPDSLRITIYLEEADKELLTTDQFIEQLMSQGDQPFLLYKDVDMAYGKFFYLQQRDLPVSKVDWMQAYEDQPVAVLDHAMKHNIIEKGEKKYFRYNNQDYEVIDLFTPKNHVMELERSFFISLDPTTNIAGVYNIDGLSPNTVNQALMSLQEEVPALLFEINPLQPTMKERIEYVLEDQFIVIIILIVTISFIGMSTIGITSAWIDSRRDEIFARYLVGARFKDIQWWLLREYLIVLTGSFTIGAICALLLVSVNAFDKVVTVFDGRGLMTSLAFCLTIGTSTLIIASWFSQIKKGIIRKGAS